MDLKSVTTRLLLVSLSLAPTVSFGEEKEICRLALKAGNYFKSMKKQAEFTNQFINSELSRMAEELREPISSLKPPLNKVIQQKQAIDRAFRKAISDLEARINPPAIEEVKQPDPALEFAKIHAAEIQAKELLNTLLAFDGENNPISLVAYKNHVTPKIKVLLQLYQKYEKTVMMAAENAAKFDVQEAQKLITDLQSDLFHLLTQTEDLFRALKALSKNLAEKSNLAVNIAGVLKKDQENLIVLQEQMGVEIEDFLLNKDNVIKQIKARTDGDKNLLQILWDVVSNIEAKE